MVIPPIVVLCVLLSCVPWMLHPQSRRDKLKLHLPIYKLILKCPYYAVPYSIYFPSAVVLKTALPVACLRGLATFVNGTNTWVLSGQMVVMHATNLPSRFKITVSTGLLLFNTSAWCFHHYDTSFSSKAASRTLSSNSLTFLFPYTCMANHNFRKSSFTNSMGRPIKCHRKLHCHPNPHNWNRPKDCSQ